MSVIWLILTTLEMSSGMDDISSGFVEISSGLVETSSGLEEISSGLEEIGSGLSKSHINPISTLTTATTHPLLPICNSLTNTDRDCNGGSIPCSCQPGFYRERCGCDSWTVNEVGSMGKRILENG